MEGVTVEQKLVAAFTLGDIRIDAQSPFRYYSQIDATHRIYAKWTGNICNPSIRHNLYMYELSLWKYEVAWNGGLFMELFNVGVVSEDNGKTISMLISEYLKKMDTQEKMENQERVLKGIVFLDEYLKDKKI